MAIQKTEALVLRTQPLRSSSLIVTFFTRSFGKIKGVVKGVRRERELRGPLYELFTQLEIVFYEKLRSDLHLVSEASMLKSHIGVRARLETIAYASYFSELADSLSELHDPHEGIYELLTFVFQYLPAVPPEKLSRLFEIKLLREIGWIPYLSACVNCESAVMENGFFSVKQGALICPACSPRFAGEAGRQHFSDARALGREALETLRYYADHSLEQGLKRHVRAATGEELKDVLQQFFLYRLGQPLKSQRFMEQMGTLVS